MLFQCEKAIFHMFSYLTFSFEDIPLLDMGFPRQPFNRLSIHKIEQLFPSALLNAS